MTEAANSVPSRERLVVLDVARGVALMGILVMNMPIFTISGSVADASHWLNHGAELLRDMLFAGKFNSIFSMLFGLGFTLQLARLQVLEPQRATAIYMRRLSWLFGIGLIHAGLFWGGDVLHVYALLGFSLLWLRRWPDRALFALMAVCLFGPALSQLARGLLAMPGALATPAAAAATGWSAAEIQAYGHGSALDVMRESLRSLVDRYTDPHELRSQLSFYAQIMTTMVLGLLIGRHRLPQRLPQLMPQVRLIQGWALAIGVVCTLVYGFGHDLDQGPGASPLKGLIGTCYVLGRLGLMGFYVLTLVRLMQLAKWQSWLSPFAAAGRMPLTNYLLQTALCSLLFYGWGFALWDKVGAAQELLLAPLVFALVQLPLSVWWMSHFDQGPFEWLWRRATYRPAAPAGDAAALK